MTANQLPLKKTALYQLHQELGARLVPFAGWEMPVQYPMGVLNEHLHTRQKAGLFDVSHMGQISVQNADAALETAIPIDLIGLKPGQQRYGVLLNDQGGIIDDLMISRDPDDTTTLNIIVNAARVDVDLPILQALAPSCHFHHNRALLALQGPSAASVMARFAPDAPTLGFMRVKRFLIGGIAVLASRSGYTGEDGFEISVAADQAEQLARLLLDQPEVAPIGLGARDSLRLEAGLCLYGHDLDETITPVEADLAWVIGKRRREALDFRAGHIIGNTLANGPLRRRIGLRPDGRAPIREGATIATLDGETIGTVTSGGPSPSLGAPIAMGYVEAKHAVIGHKVQLDLRGKWVMAEIAPMPFVTHRYNK
jgi:aminomethyltransferase